MLVQVMDGGSGGMSDLEISVVLFSPTGETVLEEDKQPRGDHRITAPQTGDYKLCLSNKFSVLSSKTVNLEVLVGPDDGPGGPGGPGGPDELEGLNSVREETTDSHLECKIKKIRDWLSQASRLQDHLRVTDLKDRRITEHNFERINFLSASSLIVLLGSSITQVILLRSLFEEKSYWILDEADYFLDECE